MYEYKMVQIPPNVSVSAKAHKGNEAAVYLEREVNKWAAQGWEFYRTDSIGVSTKPGCIAGLFGREKETYYTYYVISFRKRKEAEQQTQAAPAKTRSQPQIDAPTTGRAVFKIDDK